MEAQADYILFHVQCSMPIFPGDPLHDQDDAYEIDDCMGIDSRNNELCSKFLKEYEAFEWYPDEGSGYM